MFSLTIHTSLMPARFSGYAIGPLILIRPDCRDDAGLRAHELVHVGQFWRRPFTHDLRYLISRAYRQACEVEAYRAQLAVAPWGLEKFAASLAGKYRLDINLDAARALLAA